MKQKLTLSRLVDNNKYLRPVALVIAVLLYILVAMTDQETIDYVIPNVPVNLDLQVASLTNLRLQPVDAGEYYVDIRVNGPRTVVPQLTEDSPELATTVRLTSITGAGTFTLPVISAVSNTADLPFTIVSYSPSTIEVTLDRYQTKTFPIIAVVNGIQVPDNFVYESEQVTPQSVMVTGPEAEVAKVASAEVRLELTEELQETLARTLPIILRDAQGEEIIPEYNHLTLDETEAQVLITILKETGLPLEVEFLNEPRGFPTDALREYMNMSVDYVRIASTPDVIDRLNEITVGFIDIKRLRPGEANFNFPLALDELAGQIQSLDNITSVAVYFDDSEWETASFNISGIRMLNEPANLDVTLRSSQLNNVEFVAAPGILENMTASDIVAEIDLSDRELAIGQQNYPVKISVPGKGLVWAVGDHTTVIQVSERE